MKIIISGSRAIDQYSVLLEFIESLKIEVNCVLSGNAVGVDRLGERWAKENGKDLIIYSAQWNLFGKRAGFMRNEVMAKEAGALVLLWNGYSKGSKHMLKIARQYNLEIFEKII